jgi:SulP family sulfate permease
MVGCARQPSAQVRYPRTVANRVHTSDLDLNSMKHFGTVDLALEWAETRMIESRGGREMPFVLDLDESDLGQEIDSDDLLVLRDHSELISYPAGSCLCSAGDASEQLWIIRRGTVSIRVAGARADLRLAVLGLGCTVGEMGLLDRRPRSADVYADDDVEAYRLTLSAFEKILREHRRLGLAILAGIARQLAQRLRETSEELRMPDS